MAKKERPIRRQVSLELFKAGLDNKSSGSACTTALTDLRPLDALAKEIPSRTSISQTSTAKASLNPRRAP
jgi:hypothetical protein